MYIVKLLTSKFFFLNFIRMWRLKFHGTNLSCGRPEINSAKGVNFWRSRRRRGTKRKGRSWRRRTICWGWVHGMIGWGNWCGPGPWLGGTCLSAKLHNVHIPQDPISCCGPVWDIMGDGVPPRWQPSIATQVMAITCLEPHLNPFSNGFPFHRGIQPSRQCLEHLLGRALQQEWHVGRC